MIKWRNGKSITRNCFFGWLVGFYGLPTRVGYLRPNPIFTYILNEWFENEYIVDNISNRLIGWLVVLFYRVSTFFGLFKTENNSKLFSLV